MKGLEIFWLASKVDKGKLGPKVDKKKHDQNLKKVLQRY